MPIWIWIFILLAGGLFGLKMTYILCTAFALPATQGALYVSTTRTRIAAFLAAVPMKKGQTLVDLGCGDGRVLRRANKKYQVRAIGYEIFWLISKLKCSASAGNTLQSDVKISGHKTWPMPTSFFAIFILMSCKNYQSNCQRNSNLVL